MTAVIIENDLVKVDGVSVEMALLQTEEDLLYRAWLLGGIGVSGKAVASFIEVVASYRGWDIGIDD